MLTNLTYPSVQYVIITVQNLTLDSGEDFSNGPETSSDL